MCSNGLSSRKTFVSGKGVESNFVYSASSCSVSFVKYFSPSTTPDPDGISRAKKLSVASPKSLRREQRVIARIGGGGSQCQAGPTALTPALLRGWGYGV